MDQLFVGPYGLGLNVLYAPGREDASRKYTVDGIHSAVDFAARDGVRSPAWSSPRRTTRPDARRPSRSRSSWRTPRWTPVSLTCCSTGCITG
ncbi:MAG: hypothetical protein HND48_01990 [Chloroflexi bacterium]|nr:hypothetical protein [Chloroflexota bacterium]